MARPARHSFHIYLLAAIANGDTIISGHYVCVGYVNPGRTPNVDSIGVEASFGRRDGEVLERKVVAAEEIDMEVFAVLGSDVPDN